MIMPYLKTIWKQHLEYKRHSFWVVGQREKKNDEKTNQ